MQTFQGLAVSDGLTVGPVVRIDRGAAGLHRIVCDPFRSVPCTKLPLCWQKMN